MGRCPPGLSWTFDTADLWLGHQPILPLTATSAAQATFPHPEYQLSSPTHKIIYIFPIEEKLLDSAPSQKILLWPWMC